MKSWKVVSEFRELRVTLMTLNRSYLEQLRCIPTLLMCPKPMRCLKENYRPQPSDTCNACTPQCRIKIRLS
ncbi:hypothetical protein VTJ04DRAFT_2618 [Mycothermus thermophilus]|uniref:uncharacterized protein n=1 Tax=Humicola insolens TaxID=85995 RepID=UPI0037422140